MIGFAGLIRGSPDRSETIWQAILGIGDRKSELRSFTVTTA